MNKKHQPNRLLQETSPYLLQHAYNPVDWYPWGPEALTKAQQEAKPILLSVGYAACHWCHVMEQESFEDFATAALMNQFFVNIKVDREERPDLDSIYMAAVHLLTGRGGWPMTVFLLPDGRPFFGGSYFPSEEKALHYGIPSFKQVLQSIIETYQTRFAELEETSAEILSRIKQINPRKNVDQARNLPLQKEILTVAFTELETNFDSVYGGFGGAPKFPQPMILGFLLRYHAQTGNSKALEMVEKTLQNMVQGGIYDHLGGGFHRYSVDNKWLIPHFEKMLYDNALLAQLFLETFQVTGKKLYRQVAEETLAYLKREMLHPNGGFYSSQDADSEGKEGTFFVWNLEDVREILGKDTALFCQIFGITKKGNFEGYNVLHFPHSLAEIARVTGVSLKRLKTLVAEGRQKLWQARENRCKPGRDEKILTAWNGMTLQTFATAAAVLDSTEYLEIAQRNAAFLLQNLCQNGRVLRSWKDGKANLSGYLEDYALLADGLLSLYRIDGNSRWLQEALNLADSMLKFFWDAATNSFYDTGNDHETLIIRPSDLGDNATPAGNSVATEVLLRLAALTDKKKYRLPAEKTLTNLASTLQLSPYSFGRLLCAANFALAPAQEVVLAGTNLHSPDLQMLLRVVYQTYRPNLSVAFNLQDSAPFQLPLFQKREMLNGKATAYVCKGFACALPTTDADILSKQLQEI